MTEPYVLLCVSCGENMIVESIWDEVGEPICRNCVLNSGGLLEGPDEKEYKDIWREELQK